MAAGYRVVVEKDYLKFSAAHFIAYKGFREPLHGHNYQVSVALSRHGRRRRLRARLRHREAGHEGGLRGARRAHPDPGRRATA